MNKFFYTIPLLLLFFALWGCRQKRENSQFRPLIRAQFLASSQQTGGVMVYGLSERAEIFSLALENETVRKSITLPSLKWHFLAVGWDGANKLSGTPRCAVRTDVALSPSSLDVSLTLSAGTCAHPLFSKTVFNPSGTFLPWQLHFCKGISAVTGPSSSCQSNLGGIKSFVIYLPAFPLQSVEGPLPGLLESLSRPCQNVDVTNSVHLTDNRLPAGADILTPMRMVIRVFTADNCTGQAKNFFLLRGLEHGVPGEWKAFPAADALNIFLNTELPLPQTWDVAVWDQSRWP